MRNQTDSQRNRIDLVDRIVGAALAAGVATVDVRIIDAALDVALDHAVREIAEMLLDQARATRESMSTEDGTYWDFAAGMVVGTGVQRGWLRGGTAPNPSAPHTGRKTTAFELAAATLMARYGTLDPDELAARGADEVEIGAARNIQPPAEDIAPRQCGENR